MYRGRMPGDVDFAKKLRHGSTRGEKRFWSHIRRECLGHRFRRQHAIAGYVLDFYCAGLFLAFELDGPFHDPAKDAKRDAILNDLGIKVVRLPSLAMFNADKDISHFVSAHIEIRRSEMTPPPQRFPH